MRIVHVLEASGGGAGRQLRLLSRAQQLAGHDVTVIISPLRGDPDYAVQVANWSEAGCQLVELPMKRNPSVGDARSIRLCRNIIRSQRAEIIHTHCAKAGLVGRLAAAPFRSQGARVFHTPHSWYLHGVSGLKFGLARRLEQWLAKKTDGFLCVSQDEVQDGERWGVFGNVRKHVVLNGLPGDFAARALSRADARGELQLDQAATVIGAFTRLESRKGVQALIETLIALPDSVCLALVGEGSERDALSRTVERLNLQGRVQFLGYLPDAGRFIRALDVAVLPSWWEGRSLFALEALAAGVALVATDSPGNRFIAAHGGRLAKFGSVDALSSMIDQSLSEKTPDPAPLPTIEDQAVAMLRIYRS